LRNCCVNYWGVALSLHGKVNIATSPACYRMLFFYCCDQFKEASLYNKYPLRDGSPEKNLSNDS
jgi:hypothetical protein